MATPFGRYYLCKYAIAIEESIANAGFLTTRRMETRLLFQYPALERSVMVTPNRLAAWITLRASPLAEATMPAW